MKTTTNLAYWHAMIFAAVSLVPWWPAFGEVLTPGWGPPGTQVVVKIDRLDSEAVTAVMIGEVAAPITARGAGTVSISIPAGAASGVVTLSLGEEMITTPVSLEVTRLIPLNIGAGFSQITAGGSLFGDAVAGQVQVAVGRATLVFASNGGESDRLRHGAQPQHRPDPGPSRGVPQFARVHSRLRRGCESITNPRQSH